jgi:hypothetical protein
MVRSLIMHGSDVSCESKYGERPLHISATSRNYPLVELLVANGANHRVLQSLGARKMQCYQDWNSDCARLLVVSD